MDQMEQTKKSRKALIVGAVVVIGAAWYAFRPERLFVNTRVDESFPQAAMAQTASAAESRILSSGQFQGVAHETSGRATVYDFADGRRVLRLTDFKTSNGPDVQVYLVAADDARDDATVRNAGFVRLGALKGNLGDQNYDIPADVDLDRYRAVTIWCQRFGVNFGTAPLRGDMSASAGTMTPTVVAEGSFRSVAHESSGTATVFQLPDGNKVLRLTEFATSNGPDLHLYLVAADDAADSETVKQAGFLDIGSLKGNQGNQNYDLPSDLDLNKYRAVTVWCQRFGVNFATAPLTPPRG